MSQPGTDPIYLFFTTWVQMRQFARDRRLQMKKDTWLASNDNERWISTTERRIVFVQSSYTAEGRDFERWWNYAKAARRRNEENGYETEVLNVGHH